MTVRVSPMAAVSLAETRARSKLGMAIAAMIPMIATTINSSIRVKPCCLRIDIPLSLPLVSDSERSGENDKGGHVRPPLSATTGLPKRRAGCDRQDAGGATVGIGNVRHADDAARVATEGANARGARGDRRRLIAVGPVRVVE